MNALSIDIGNMYYEFMLDSIVEDQSIMEAMIQSDIMEMQGFCESEDKSGDSIFAKIGNWIKTQLQKIKDFFVNLKNKVVGFFKKSNSNKKADEVKKAADAVKDDFPNSGNTKFPIEIGVITTLNQDVIEGLVKGRGEQELENLGKHVSDDHKEMSKTIASAMISATGSDADKLRSIIQDIKNNNDKKSADSDNKVYRKVSVDYSDILSLVKSGKAKDKLLNEIKSKIDNAIKCVSDLEKQVNSMKNIKSENVPMLKELIGLYRTSMTSRTSVYLKEANKINSAIDGLLNNALQILKNNSVKEFFEIDDFSDNYYDHPANTNLDYLWANL